MFTIIFNKLIQHMSQELHDWDLLVQSALSSSILVIKLCEDSTLLLQDKTIVLLLKPSLLLSTSLLQVTLSHCYN